MSYIMQPYDDALRYILDNGTLRENRTGINTLSVFGHTARYDISKNFPILTKRKMYPASVFKELLWIISGSTNVNDLEAMGSKIWTSWKDKEFEERNGYNDGELGPIYGWQLRHFGAPYGNRHYMSAKNWIGIDLGFDQLVYIVNELKTNRNSRRILFSYWNPNDVTADSVRLPPCHNLFQLNCNDGKLSGMLYQRSCDFPIGGPANIQFYSAMIYMLCQQCGEGLTPGEFIHTTADSHIYENQILAVNEYLSRSEIESPILKLNQAKDMFSYTPEDFEIIDYNSAEAIKFEVAV